jgi:hypothetical protein
MFTGQGVTSRRNSGLLAKRAPSLASINCAVVRMRCRSCERSPPERIARQVALRPRYSRRAACHTPVQDSPED